MSAAASNAYPRDLSSSAPEAQSNVRWFVCFLLFLATTINYMDRSVFSLIEPLLHLPFMGWVPGLDHTHQAVYDINFGRVLIFFQVAYGVGFLFAGRIIDKLGTKTGYAIAILIWACASISHSLVTSVAGFCIARVFLGLGESGNFPAAIKATAEWFPTEERAKAVGFFNSGSNASAFIAPVLIAAVTAKWGWHAAFICTGSMGLVWCVIWLVFPYNKLRRTNTSTQRDLAPVLPHGPSYGDILSKRGFWAFFIGKGMTDPIWWLSLLSAQVPERHLRARSQPREVSAHRHLHRGQRGVDWRRLALWLPDEPRPHRQLRPQNSDADLRTVRHADHAGTVHGPSVSDERVAGYRTFLPRDGRASGLVGQHLLDTGRYVSIDCDLHGCWAWRRGWCGWWRAVHVHRVAHLLVAPVHDLRDGRVRLCERAGDLPSSGATPGRAHRPRSACAARLMPKR
jgi:hypothetical protein